MTFSLSDAVIVSLPSFTWKRKQSSIASEFLLLITFAKADNLLLKAVLDNVNFISIFMFLLFCSIVGTKIQKIRLIRKKYLSFLMFLK
jgi:hypothetical protein